MPDEDARLTDFLPDEGSDDIDGGTPTDEGSDDRDGGGEREGEDEPPDERVDEPPDERVGEPPDERDPDEAVGPDGESDPDGEFAPAVATADWTPGGGTCEVCGASVERRWRDAGALVCADCKAW